MTGHRVTLSGASWLRGAACLDAEVRSPTAADLLALLDDRDAQPARATTDALARALERLGPVRPVTADDARSLTLGDRDALMLRVRAMATAGPLECSTACECGERLELTADPGTLLLGRYEGTAEWYERDLGGQLVRFRLPTGGDQEEAAALAAVDPDAAAGLVLRRCVAAVDGSQPRELHPSVAAALPSAMAELDPQADVALEAPCPACGARVEVALDVAGFVLAELRRAADDLLHDVHRLATAYHWSERDIVAVAPARRRRYLELVDSTPADEWATSY